MIIFRTVALSLLIAPLVYGQSAGHKPPPKPIETTVCKVLDDPATFDNRFVKVSGFVQFWQEGSELRNDDCPNEAIWFAGFGDVILPEVIAIVSGHGEKASGRPAIPVTVVRDASFKEFTYFMNRIAKAQQCLDRPPPDIEHLADCMTYRITATFTGRIDGVSKQVHAAHLKLKRKFGGPADGKGFGHMGAYDAQIVVQSVEGVVAAREFEAR